MRGAAGIDRFSQGVCFASVEKRNHGKKVWFGPRIFFFWDSSVKFGRCAGTLKGRQRNRGMLRTFLLRMLVVDFDRYFVHGYGVRTHIYCSCVPPLALSQWKETFDLLPAPKMTKNRPSQTKISRIR